MVSLRVASTVNSAFVGRLRTNRQAVGPVMHPVHFFICLAADFGIVLGCKIYVREVLHRDKDGLAGAGPGNSLQEGDVLLKINNHSADGLSLKEARKLMDASKEKLSLLVRREARSGASSGPSGQQPSNLYGGPSSHNNSSLQSKGKYVRGNRNRAGQIDSDCLPKRPPSLL